MNAIWFTVAAALGAGGRFLLYRLEHSWQAVLIANTVGSLILGVVFAADLGTNAQLILGVGLCGALTTFSSFADELHRLGPRRGTVYAVVTVVLASGAIALANVVI
jgi:CrcB protein